MRPYLPLLGWKLDGNDLTPLPLYLFSNQLAARAAVGSEQGRKGLHAGEIQKARAAMGFYKRADKVLLVAGGGRGCVASSASARRIRSHEGGGALGGGRRGSEE
jgi:hypothetical protein